MGAVARGADLQQSAGIGRLRGTYDGNLAGVREGIVQRDQPLGETQRIANQQWLHRTQRSLCQLGVARFDGQPRQAQQHKGGHGVAGGDGVVLQFPGAGDQRLVVVAGVEKATVGGAKVFDHPLGQLTGGLVPTRIEGGLVQLQQPFDEVGVILQVAVNFSHCGARVSDRARFPGVPQAALVTSEFAQQEIGIAFGDLAVIVPVQRPRSFGKGGQHQAIPRGQDLFVTPWMHPLLTGGKQLLPRLRQLCALVHATDEFQNVPAFKVARFGDPVRGYESLCFRAVGRRAVSWACRRACPACPEPCPELVLSLS